MAKAKTGNRADIYTGVEETARRAIRDLEDLARGCPGVRAYEIQRTVDLLRASISPG